MTVIIITSEYLHHWASSTPCKLWTQPHKDRRHRVCWQGHCTSPLTSADTWSSSHCWSLGQRLPCLPHTEPQNRRCGTSYTSQRDWQPSSHTTAAVLCPVYIIINKLKLINQISWKYYIYYGTPNIKGFLSLFLFILCLLLMQKRLAKSFQRHLSVCFISNESL